MNTSLYSAVQEEIDSARRLEDWGNVEAAFRHLERAHVLGQTLTATHVRVHWEMLRWGVRQRRPREIIGQLLRIAGAATKTAIGWVPHGNTGGANVSPIRPMPIPPDLQQQIDHFETNQRSTP